MSWQIPAGLALLLALALAGLYGSVTSGADKSAEIRTLKESVNSRDRQLKLDAEVITVERELADNLAIRLGEVKEENRRLVNASGGRRVADKRAVCVRHKAYQAMHESRGLAYPKSYNAAAEREACGF